MLTVLLNYFLASLHEVYKALILVACHCSISSPLQGQIWLKMCIQMFFEGQIANESHATDVALELDTLEHFDLSGQARSER